MKHDKIIQQLSLEQKCSLLSGQTTFGSRGIPSKNIPAFIMSDGPHGLRHQAGAADHLGIAKSEPATCFPPAGTMANSWDPALGEEVGKALGEEAAGQGVSVLLGPGLNMKRDPLCGRNFEYFAEDPYLAGKMAASYVRGIQAKGISACPKHYAVNSQETRRMASDSILDERTLREVYLTGFEITVKEANPWSIMTSYNLVNGTYANENEHLLKDILKNSFGFDGAVITDWGGSNDHALGVKHGSALEMPAPGLGASRELLAAIKSGKISEKDVDARVDELLTLIDRTQAAINAHSTYDENAHHQLARKAAGECIVLLKNEDNILPLVKGTKVALIGDFAETPRYQGSGSSVVNSTKVDSLKDMISSSGLGCIGYAQGFERTGGTNDALRNKAIELAKKADTILLCMGLNESNESEGAERLNMKVEQNQIDLINAIHAVNKNIIVLFFSGSTVEVPFINKAKAFVYAGLSGQAGAGAILDVLEGKINPSGKLSETWPMSYEDTPAKNFPSQEKCSLYEEALYIGYRYYETANIPVRFPFGYGLSYTTFAYDSLRASDKSVSFTLTNTGTVDGTEIAQVYVAKKGGKFFRAAKELKGFARVDLKAGETKTITINLDDKAFRYWNVKTNKWEIEGGAYDIEVGASSLDIRLKAEVSLQGTTSVNPYEGKDLSAYDKADIKNVPASQFKALLGHEIPTNKASLDENMTFGDLNHSRSIIFWIVWLVLKAKKTANEKKGKADLNVLFIWNMPLRALAKMTNGMVDMGMVKGMVYEVKGYWLFGLAWLALCYFVPALGVVKFLGFFWCLLYVAICFIKNMIQNKIMDGKVQ